MSLLVMVMHMMTRVWMNRHQMAIWFGFQEGIGNRRYDLVTTVMLEMLSRVVKIIWGAATVIRHMGDDGPSFHLLLLVVLKIMLVLVDVH